ncbi:MAG: IPT/TIG domain-containing protein [Patescibacteria group bacterium]|jgi:hypothetical protein
MKREVLLPIVVFSETFILYFLIIIPAEFLLTEYFLITPTISNQAKTIIFAIIFFFIFLANYFRKKFFNFSKRALPFLVIIFTAGLIGNKYYQAYYQSLQDKPKIYQISTNWGIQAMPITLTGKNFGPVWRPGKIYVGEVPLIIESWSNNEVVAKLPVPPRHFKDKIYIIDGEGNKSNHRSFEIRDPDKLHALR